MVFLVYGTFGVRTYLRREVLQREVALDRDDFDWLITRALNLFRRSPQPLPPQGIYNAGQKLFAVLVYLMIPLIMITGIIMSFHLISTTIVAWAVVVHFVVVGLVVAGLMIHVYMGAVFSEEKPAFFSMITGMVNELYAYRHHSKWWKEMMMRRDTAEAELAGVAETNLQPPPSAEPGVLHRHSPSPLMRALRTRDYWPPYVAGFGLGVTLLLTFVIMGQGLGASGGITRWVAGFVSWVFPGYANSSPY